MYLTICLNPTLQRTLVFNSLKTGAVNRAIEKFLDASGKGVNVTRVLHHLGCDAEHITYGSGAEADTFEQLAIKSGVTVHMAESTAIPRTCTTAIDISTSQTTELVEEGDSVNTETEENIFKLFRTRLPESHTVIISGSKAQGFSDNIFYKMTEEAIAQGKKVILDIRGKDLITTLEAFPHVIKPNMQEFFQTFFPEAEVTENNITEEQLKLAGKKAAELEQNYGCATVLTMGSLGTFYYEASKWQVIPAEQITPLNTIGCGDAFTAGFSSIYAQTDNVVEAINKGQQCGMLNALQIRPGYIK